MSAKKRRLDSGDGFDEESGSSGSQTAIRVSTSAVGSIEFSADQDGSGKWVKLGNVGKEVGICLIQFNICLFWFLSLFSDYRISTLVTGCLNTSLMARR